MLDIKLHQLMPTRGMDSGSPFCVKVHRALAYKGLDYTPLNVNSPGELKALNPRRSKLPVLEYNGKLILDSTGHQEVYDLIADPGEATPLTDLDPTILARLRAVAAASVTQGAAAGQGEPLGDLDPETLQALRELGYLE